MVQEQVLDKLPDENIAVHCVWTNVLRTDNSASVDVAVRDLPDKRVTHYWDGSRSLGTRYGKIMELPLHRDFAWDIYFIYGRDVRWEVMPPEPTEWMHQLKLKDGRALDGGKLRETVTRLLKS